MSPTTIRIQHDGRERVCKVRDYEELTLEDWKTLTSFQQEHKEGDDELSATYRLVELFTGVKEAELNTYPLKGVRGIIEALGDELAMAQQGSDDFKKALQEDREWTPEPIVEIGGKTFRVPIDVEIEAVWGQFADWQRWQVPEHESDLVAEALAFMLVEEGQEYSGTPKEKVELMRQCRMCIAFDLCAFFFARSEQFRNVMSQRSQRFRMWTTQLIATALKVSPTDTEALLSSMKPPS